MKPTKTGEVMGQVSDTRKAKPVRIYIQDVLSKVQVVKKKESST